MLKKQSVKIRGGVGVAACLVFGAIGLFPQVAQAQGLRLHVEAGAAKAIANAQQRETSWGALGNLELEWRVARPLGLQLGVGALELSDGDPPQNPEFADRTETSAQFAMLGARVYPFSADQSSTISPAGLWLDANLGVARTGDLLRPGLQ